MSPRRIFIGGLAALAVAVAGCGAEEKTATTATSTPVTTTPDPPRPLTDYLLGDGEYPGISVSRATVAGAIELARLGKYYTGQDRPECVTRNTVINLVPQGSDSAAMNLVSNKDIQILMLDHPVDVAALAATMQACPMNTIKVKNGSGGWDVTPLEIPRTVEVAGVGPVIEMDYIRDAGSAGFMPYTKASTVRFVSVGQRTVVEFVSGDLMSSTFPLPEQLLAFADEALAGQVEKVRKL
ncbi:hypothetical protein [Nocardia yamanashiensis]|uniref:hypothetical protein n=1 Tax=Nocardia yamanashiensis TaxID=209247 RepID=UPI000B317F84|nr:hypothetical protein [Nocardia yamanashiensis]